MTVPAGFSGWWCSRCGRPCENIPDDLDAAQARCPHCRKWTAVWVPPAAAVDVPRSHERSHDHRPRAARGRELFEHMRAVVEDPALNPDLKQEYKR